MKRGMRLKIKQLQMLQKLQDAYSSLCGLTIMITDAEGNRLTEFSGLLEIVTLLLENGMKPEADTIPYIMEKVHGIQKPIVYESIRGLKLLITPVRIDGHILYYILAGIVLDENNKDRVVSRVAEDVPAHKLEQWKRALNSTPACSQERIEEILGQLEELKEMIQFLLERERMEEIHASRLQFLTLLSLMDRGDPNWMQGVLGVFVRVMQLEFAGFARKTKGEQFTITETVGFKEETSLQGACFFTGEGFFGQVALTMQMGYWEKPSRDPRVSFFTKRGLQPAVVICYPIKYNGQLLGLLFGGHTVTQELSEELADMGALLINQLSADIYCLESEGSKEQHRIRIETLHEMIRGIMEIKEKERFFQMLIESFQLSAQTPFICLVLKKQEEEGMKLYASGIRANQLSTAYADDVAMSYFGDVQGGISFFRKPVYREWNGLKLVEVPLVFGQTICGVIGVDVENVQENKQLIQFLNTLISLMVTKLQFASKAAVDIVDSATLLHQTLSVWKPEAYYKTLKAKSLTQLLLKELNFSIQDIELIGQASLLSEYDPELLSSWIGETPAVGLLREVRRHMSGNQHYEHIGNETCNMVKKALHMILWHGEHREKEWPSTLQFSLKEEPLKHAIERLLAARNELKPALELKPDWQGRFTSREAEVLNLVLQGLNNLEIAKKLFISTHTVKNHITKIYEKLGVNDRAQAIAKMYQTGLAASTQER
jgi:DNA-binding CsgD family transcriptional regulator/ligand-binding sensor protein